MAVTSAIALLTLLVFSAYSWSNEDDKWIKWKKLYRKQYFSAAEEQISREIWRKNAYLVNTHNKNSSATFKMELNEFADMEYKRTPIEIGQWKHGVDPEKQFTKEDIPDSWDWRTKGDAGRVHNQGQTGSSESFVITDSVTSFVCISTGRLVELSNDEVIDCCSKSGRLFPNDIYECIHQHGGLCLAGSYISGTGKCQNTSCTGIDMVKKTVHIKQGDEHDLVLGVLKNPVAATIDASHTSFQLYRSGVYNERNCSSTRLDHAVLIVGYGTYDGKYDYWLVKNSWGPSWGMDGYIMMSRNRDNQCGIATFAEYPSA